MVYSSLPLRGTQGAAATALTNGIRLALQQAGSQAGGLRVRYRSLDNSTTATQGMSPAVVAENARTAVRDGDAVAYIGELGEGSAISIPISNEAGLAQVGTTDTAVGLTKDDSGAGAEEPERYYPSTKRTFVRIVPRDTVQGAALVSLARQRGCTRLAIAGDASRFGLGLVQSLRAAAAEQRLEIALDVTLDRRRTNFGAQARRAELHDADCFAFAGLPARAAVRAFEAFGAALTIADLFGPERLADPAFSDPDAGGVAARVARRIRLTVSALQLERSSQAQAFAREYRRAHGGQPPPSALYGYEAMRLVLDAVKRSGDGDRTEVMRELLETRDRQSVLGAYSIDPDGDTTRSEFGVASIVGSRLEVQGAVRAELAG